MQRNRENIRAWREMSLDLPQQLIVNTMDLSPLMSVLTAVSSKLEELSSSVALLQNAQRQMTADIADTTQKVVIQQKHYEVMFETVSVCNRKVLDLERISATKEETNSKFATINLELANLSEAVRRMNISKIDKTSEELEVRVKAAAAEACVSFLNKKDIDTKEYIKNTVDASEQKVIRVAYARVDDAMTKSEQRCVQLGHRIDDAAASIHGLRREMEQEAATQAAVDRSLVAKLEQHEIFFNKLEDGVAEDIDNVAGPLHMVMQRVFGLSITDLARSITTSETAASRAAKKEQGPQGRGNDEEEEEEEGSRVGFEAPLSAKSLLVLPEEQLIRAANGRQLRRVTRAIEFTKLWRNVRAASAKALQGAPIACNNLDQGIDLNEASAFTKIDQALAVELKTLILEDRKRTAANRLFQLSEQYPVTAAPLLLQTPWLQAASAASRTQMESTVSGSASSVEVKIRSELEVIVKELRGKMSNTKAMELIDQRTTRMLGEAMVPANSAIEGLTRSAITRAEVYEALSNKADVSRMELKADHGYVHSVTGEVRTELNDSIADLKDMYQKLLAEVTLFRHKALIEDKCGGIEGAAGDGVTLDRCDAGVAARCLSCRQPLPPKQHAAATRDATMQEAQKSIHEAQLKQASGVRTPSKPSGDGTAFSLGQWVQGVEAKYVPVSSSAAAPPANSGARAAGPRPPSAK